MTSSEPGEPGRFVNAFGTYVGRDDRGWFVATVSDGGEKVISRHASREAAEHASADLNESANPDPPGRS